MSKINIKKNNDVKKLENEVIVQHNNLIEARYRLSLQEKRIIFWLASQIQLSDEDLKIHKINIKDFCNIVDVKSKNMYREIEKVTHRLMQRVLSIKNLNENYLIQINWLNLAKYSYNEGIVELCFNPHIKPFLLNIKDNFTKITLSDIMRLRSIYAVRIYELLKQYEPLKKREISILELREYCGIDKNKYKNYNDFKRKIIESAFKEINEKTDITFSIEEIKRSRKIVSIIFHINKNQQYTGDKLIEEQDIINHAKKIKLEFEERKRILQRIIEYGFSKRTAGLMIKGLTDLEAKEAIKAVEIQIARDKVLNTRAMLRTALKEKWKPDVYKARPKK